ncbi:ribbon-helix-helix protein, CopG family [Methylomonas koyamae]|uniref:ribbon-helix-helix protein, CopG family n=1 Tax=Methylomonas koyamae TaxID=702114 RepID=UPI000A3E0BE7|nr:CopG family transcriptional regulator [Methylomonas koyamae]
MPAISLRLPDDVEANLKAEAQLEGKSQSEIARLAITEYLARRERERFMAEMVAEVRTAYATRKSAAKPWPLPKNSMRPTGPWTD